MDPRIRIRTKISGIRNTGAVYKYWDLIIAEILDFSKWQAYVGGYCIFVTGVMNHD
jgi:hypothetical protein